MIDAKLLRSDTDRVRAALARRGAADEVDAFLELDGRRRTLLASVEQSRADANAAAKEIGDGQEGGPRHHRRDRQAGAAEAPDGVRGAGAGGRSTRPCTS